LSKEEGWLYKRVYDFIVGKCSRVRGSPYADEARAESLARALAARIEGLVEKYPELAKADLAEAVLQKLDDIIVCTDEPSEILSNFDFYVKTGFGLSASPGEMIEDKVRALMAEKQQLESMIEELERIPEEELSEYYVEGEPIGTEERRREILEKWRREVEEIARMIEEIEEQKARRRWSPIEAYSREAEELKKRFEDLTKMIDEVFKRVEGEWRGVKPFYEKAEQILKEYESGRTELLEKEGAAVLSNLEKWYSARMGFRRSLEQDVSMLNRERERLLADVRALKDKIIRRRLKKITPESLGLTNIEHSLTLGATSGSIGMLEKYVGMFDKLGEYISSLSNALKKLEEKKPVEKPAPTPPPPPPKIPPAPTAPAVPPPAPAPPPEEMRIVMEKRRAFEDYLRTRVPRVYRVDWSGFYTARISYHAGSESDLRKALEEVGAKILRVVEGRGMLKIMYADFTPAKAPAPAPPAVPPAPKPQPPANIEEEWKKIVSEVRRLAEEWITLYVPPVKAPGVRVAVERVLREVEPDVKALLRAGRSEEATHHAEDALREVAEIVISINPRAREHPRIKALVPGVAAARPAAPAPAAELTAGEVPWWMPGKPPGVGWQTWKWAKFLSKLEDLMRGQYERMASIPTLPPMLRGHPNPWVESFPPLAESKDSTVELHPTTVAGLVKIAERAGLRVGVKTEWGKGELLNLIDKLKQSPRLGSHEREWLSLLRDAVEGRL
jgi:hypothetical protein